MAVRIDAAPARRANATPAPPRRTARPYVLGLAVALVLACLVGLLRLGLATDDDASPPVVSAAPATASLASAQAPAPLVESAAMPEPVAVQAPAQGIASVEKDGFQGIPNDQLVHPADDNDPNNPFVLGAAEEKAAAADNSDN